MPQRFETGCRPAHKLLVAIQFIGALVLSLGLAACSATGTSPAANLTLSEDVQIEELGPGVWRHVSLHHFATGPFPSNGLIVRSKNGAILIDTAWNSQQTARILDWTEQNVGAVEALFISHAHVDRLGGLSEIHRRHISAYALAATIQRSAANDGPVIGNAVASAYGLDRWGVDGEFYFPGAGHAPDNAVVYLATSRILAGGCMVRSLDAQTLGNTGDADVTSWPIAIRTLQDRYPDAELIIPGHGAPGDTSLLAHTLNLLRINGD